VAALPAITPASFPPESADTGAAPVSGAPLGTTETWPGVGAPVGATLGTGDGAALAGASLGSVVAGAGVGAVEAGTGLGPSANAGTALANTAVHASAVALRTVRRIKRSLSSVAPTR
jgi:hypothetical protein